MKENGDQCSYAQIFDREISAPACFPQLSVLKTGTTVVDFTQISVSIMQTTAIGHKSIKVCRD